MGDVSDEALMAFADGELSLAERVEIEKALARDPGLRARLEIFEATGRRLSAEFADRLNEPLPRHLVDTVMKHRTVDADVREPNSASTAATVWDRIARGLSFGVPAWQAALASIAVLLAGIGAGYRMSVTVPSSVPPLVEPLIALADGDLVVGGRLAQILETRPSHILHDLENTGRDRRAKARIRFTFRSEDGYCRQFEVTGRSGVHATEVACRSGDGVWRVRVHANGGAGPPIGEGAKPAGREGAAIEAEVARLQIGDALGAEDEAEVISRGWQR